MRFKTFFEKVAIFSAVFVVSVFIFSAGAFAQIIVTNTNDAGEGSLRQAIIDANNNPGADEIVFSEGLVGEIDLTIGQMGITDHLTITGPSLDMNSVPQITIDAQEMNRIFLINDSNSANDISVSITGLRFINGIADEGGAIFNREDLTIDSCVFEDNEAELGGAIFNDFGSTISKITHSTFTGNIAITENFSARGGAIFNHNFVTITEIAYSTFSENEAKSITRFASGGAIFSLSSESIMIGKITHSAFSGNIAMSADIGSTGGAITAGTINEIAQSTFTGNMATSEAGTTSGGAIMNHRTITNITQCAFSGNKALSEDGDTRGGAIYVFRLINEIAHSTFTDNESATENGSSSGGAIYIEEISEIDEITYSDFNGNTAISTNGVAGGGAIHNNDTLTYLTHSTFTDNKAITVENSGLGGAIANVGEIYQIYKSTFNNNTATSTNSVAGGGAIFNSSIIQAIEEVEFRGNSVSALNDMSAGGAISNTNQINLIKKSTFGGNMSEGDGGAITNTTGSPLNITHTIFNGNMASRDGGAILSNSIITITNATFTGNTVDGRGGAIRSLGIVNVSFTTIANNKGDDGGGVSAIGGGTFNIENSIVGNNAPSDCGDFVASIIASGVNFDTDGTCPDFTQVSPAVLNLDPAGPQDNGGPTQTIALITPSAAIDAVTDCTNTIGDPVTTDQRGFPRPLPEGGSCDSGAFELGFIEIEITKVSIPSGGTGFPFSGSPGFSDGLPDCEITQDFVLDDQDSVSCVVPAGDYTITEHLGAGEVVSIFCEQLPEDSSIDSLNGMLSFTIAHGGAGVDCVFVNSFANTVVRVGDEAPGDNCEFGGTKIESGFDNNQNGVLDDDEVIPEDTNYICEEEAGQDGDDGQDGQDGINSLIDLNPEPPGDNCPNGGVRVDTGLDLNKNGVLDPEEINDTSYICNPSSEDDGTGDPNLNSGDGSGNNGCSGSSLTGDGPVGLDSYAELLVILLMPFVIAIGRRLRAVWKDG